MIGLYTSYLRAFVKEDKLAKDVLIKKSNTRTFFLAIFYAQTPVST